MKKKKVTSSVPAVSQADEKQARDDFWSEVYHRLETAAAAAEQGYAPTVQEKKKILKARARELAREPQRDEAAEEYVEVVGFLLAGEEYAVESAYVREVCPLKEFTPLPGIPPFVLGIINVRGQIISVIDIKKFFDLPEKGITDLNQVIILRSDSMEFSILADDVLGAYNVPVREIQPSLPTLTGIRQEYLKGITGKREVILDAAKLLSDRNIIVHQEV